MNRRLKPNPKLSAQDRGTLYELRQRMEEGGFDYSVFDILRLESRIIRLRATGEWTPATSADGVRDFFAEIKDGLLEITATYRGPELTPIERGRRERKARKSIFRGKVQAGEKRKKGEAELPPGWEPQKQIFVREEVWDVRDALMRPSGLLTIVEEEFRPDIERISKIALKGFWAILESRQAKSGRLFLGGQEVPAKASNPDFRAALIPHLQKPRVTMQVVWGAEPDNVETIHLSVSGDRLVVVWDGQASGAKA